MKKLILAIVAVFAVTVVTNAQGLGVKLGANMTKIDGVKFKDAFNTSYQAGAFLELNLSDKFGIQPELLFTQSSVKQDTSLAQVIRFQNSGDLKLNYLTIPVLLRFNASKLITFHVGPQFGILLNKEENLLQNGERAFKNGDFSMLAGVQLNISSFRVYGRYNVGLSDISDVTNSGKWKYQQIQLGLGMKIL